MDPNIGVGVEGGGHGSRGVLGFVVATLVAAGGAAFRLWSLAGAACVDYVGHL